jgi:hypothetical protein
MQSRLTAEVLFHLLSFTLKLSYILALTDIKWPLRKFLVKTILEQGSCCWELYYVERYPVNFLIRLLKFKSKIKPGLNKVVSPLLLYSFKRIWNTSS